MIDRTLLQQLYNVAVTRNPILYLYIIKKLNNERPFLKEIQEIGYFTIEKAENEGIPRLIEYFESYPENERKQFAQNFVKKLELLGISYKIEKNKYSIENRINVDFEQGGASLKQIHKTVGKGYSKSYMQRIVIGKLKQPRSPFDGKVYPIIISKSIKNQKTKIFTLSFDTFEALEKEEKNLEGGVISRLFIYELELKSYLDLVLSKRKILSQIQIQLDNLKKQIKKLRLERKNLINKIKISENFQYKLEQLEILLESMNNIQENRDNLWKLIKNISNIKKDFEEFLKKLNRVSFAELPSFYKSFEDMILHFRNKKLSIFEKAENYIEKANLNLKKLTPEKISEIKLDYQQKYFRYIKLKKDHMLEN